MTLHNIGPGHPFEGRSRDGLAVTTQQLDETDHSDTNGVSLREAVKLSATSCTQRSALHGGDSPVSFVRAWLETSTGTASVLSPSHSGHEVTEMAEGTGRTEAFSDGIFAIAITLLVLEIHLPEAGGKHSLWNALAAQWPSYFAFALSFFVILVTWINHHDLLQLVRADSRRFQLANGLLMFYVVSVPFPTAVLAANLAGTEISPAVTLYCGTFVVGSIAWRLLFTTIGRDHLFRTDVDAHTIRHISRSIWMGLSIHVSAALLALVLPWLALAITAAVRLFFLHLSYQTASSVPGQRDRHNP
jgi:uncharacterized membrane protein